MNNMFVLIGRISKELELKYSKDNKPILSLPLAIANGKDDTTFITVSVFGVLADTINKYCKKGDIIGVNGLIKNNNWEDKDGNKHYDYQFIVSKANFLSTKKEPLPNAKSKYDEDSNIQLSDKDLPF